jgi:hypothetical protein
MYESSVGPVPARIYFCLVVVVGSIFLLSMVLAVVTDCYDQAVREANDSSEAQIAAMMKVIKGLASWANGPVAEPEIARMARKMLIDRRKSAVKRTIVEPPRGRLRERLNSCLTVFKRRLEVIALFISDDIAVNSLVLHERLGVGVVSKWDEMREKWEVAFFGHHHVRAAAAAAKALDGVALAGLEMHRFTKEMARKKLLLAPDRHVRMAAMEVFQSSLYQGFVTLCVLGNTAALCAYHYNNDVFMQNYVQAMWDHCHSVLPTLAQAAFSIPANYTSYEYTQLWEWRKAVQSSANISAGCTEFFATGGSGLLVMPPSWEPVLDWTNNAFSIFFVFDMLLSLVAAVSTQPKAQLRATVDAAVSCLTVIGLGIPFFSVFAVLRLFTSLFRLVKVFRMRKLERILLGLGDAMSAIVPLLLLVGFFVFFFAILGVQFFGSSSSPYISPDGILLPTPNFLSMWPNEWGYGAMMTVIQILTGENWNSIMFQVMIDVHPAAVLYFLVVNCFGVCALPTARSAARSANMILQTGFCS